jgi:hypothetical protein
MQPISINRAPVRTLWAAVVAQRLGFDEDEALTVGEVAAGLNAQANGRRLGIFKPDQGKAKKAREKERGERVWIEVSGRPVPATNTDDGIRAARGSKPIDPDNVRRYLSDKFGDDRKGVRSAMRKLARACKPLELAHDAYRLYERFRLDSPAGTKGWGAKGELDLGQIEWRGKGRGQRLRGGSGALPSAIPGAGVAEFDAQRAGGQQAQNLKSAAGGALVGHLRVAGADGAARPRLHRPAVAPQGGQEGFRTPERLNADVHG